MHWFVLINKIASKIILLKIAKDRKVIPDPTVRELKGNGRGNRLLPLVRPGWITIHFSNHTFGLTARSNIEDEGKSLTNHWC